MLWTKNTTRLTAEIARHTCCAALSALLAACATQPSPVDPPSPPSVSQPREGPLAAQSEPRARRSPFSEPPGVFFSDVTQANISSTICMSGWTATVRPSTSFTQGAKRKMLLQAGADPSEALRYELDHFVPLALGGHPRSIDNLWLQRWDGQWSARIKDRLERTLHAMVCAGKLTLLEARTSVQHDWRGAYKKFVTPGPDLREMQEEEVVE